jgi:dipeptidyl aminopeptidase/acylaminoacyl peptidase
MPRTLAFFAIVSLVGVAPAETGYQKAPPAIRKILDIPPFPVLSLSPKRDYAVLAEATRYPPIEDLARPILRLAGVRIDPATNGPQRGARFTGLTLRSFFGWKATTLELPDGGRPDLPVWSPDGTRFALAITFADRIDLYLGQPGSAKLTKVQGLHLNAALGAPIHWLADGKSLVVHAVVPTRGKPPARPTRPAGPVIQETVGKVAPARTYQDLLRDEHDAALFDYYARSQLYRVDAATGKAEKFGPPGVFASCLPSPDGRHLLVTRLERPYSYLLPMTAFPRSVAVWPLDGRGAHPVAKLPLADNVPIEGVPTGRRQVRWHPDRPASLVWVEALDGGDPKKKVPRRDRVSLADPFGAMPVVIAETEHRFADLAFGEKGTALLSDFDRETRRRRTFVLGADAKPKPLWDRSIQDRYNDPGTPLTRRLPSGHQVLRQKGDTLLLVGAGSSPKGDRPFLDRYDLKTGKSTRLFQSSAEEYETPIDVLEDGEHFITRHESPTSPPNYRLRTIGKDTFDALTDIRDPAPELRKITRRRVVYKRPDGVPLSFTLYLPPDYKEGTRLPTVVWAYPREFTDAGVAGQVVGSTSHYTTLVGTSHLFFLLAGYAVLDNASMPVVGSAEKANDTFVEQIVASAKAAIDKAVELGVTDPKRVGVGGHSYGAFMTANLLAHSDLFRAGIARSGAYNRTLTPFGFQSERRTLWQAPNIYLEMSPFMKADKIKAPLLLIHGEADNNSGTFPIQSERMYQAIKGNGGKARFVSLPSESHGYAARESVEHTLWEMVAWFDEHVKKP